jgi:alkyl hydroperoxide reductase subunit AhpF
VVSLAHKFAFENPQIKVEAISAVALPELAQSYKILGTPHMVLNGEAHLKGRMQEEQLLAAIQSLWKL